MNPSESLTTCYASTDCEKSTTMPRKDLKCIHYVWLFFRALSLFVHKSVFNLFHVVHIQEPIFNVADLKEIHSEIKCKVPEPILFTNSHDGIDIVSLKYLLSVQVSDYVKQKIQLVAFGRGPPNWGAVFLKAEYKGDVQLTACSSQWNETQTE